MKAKKLTSLLLVLVLTFVMSSGAFATTTLGSVTVSISYGNFNTDGDYVGGGFTNANFYIEDYEISIDDIQDYVDGGLQELVYLPANMSYLDPNVLDAIIVALYENGFYDVYGGWDNYPIAGDPGGYIYDVPPQTLTTDPTTIVTIDGVDYYKYSGTGWNVACTQGTAIDGISTYGTDYELFDGMEIIFDVSPYIMYWPV